jgi:membrane fusion protein (multidrug efflux system)
MSEQTFLPAQDQAEQQDTGSSQPKPARSYSQEHPRAKWVLLLLVIALAVAAYFVWKHYASRESTDDAQIDGNIVPVASRVGGTVIKINAKENQEIEASSVLVQLDSRDYEVALQKAEAQLADARATAHAARMEVPIMSTTTASQLSNAKAAVQAALKEVADARARQQEAEANYEKAASDVRRYAELVQQDEIPRQQYDTAVTTEKAARAAVDSRQASVAAAESRVTQAESQVSAAETAPQHVAVTQARANSTDAAVQQAEAAVRQARLNLNYTVIKAAVSGVISKKENVQLGQIVQPGQPLMAIVPLDDIWVTVNFKENQLKDMRVGQPATIHVDAYGRDYRAHVDSIGAATGARFSLLPPENATGNYVKVVQRVPVKLLFEKGEDPQHLLRPGMSVVPTVMTNVGTQ